ncbi:DUF4365 domain-containing protein [Pseudoalteromonas umbrosa]|uniref:DUF4365 domain-containing protein n=1 Tax=Pseudoalteromonas umbrosa TaxID=3048489 RepID=UPI0024C429AE|nr:DUF4365 domain-containing protein [Pseudoalteromonas sp. B95]MDK1287415.1 DUF4365 domain-containing protein [Pseudoalteromonas sp. B95]
MEENNSFPKESNSQELGRLAADKFGSVKPETWLVKEIDGDKDFGIDYFIQLKDFGSIKYNFLAQLKGTKDKKRIREDSIVIDLKTSTLNYYANQGLVMVIVCDLNNDEYYYEYLHNILYNLNGNNRYLSEPPKTYSVKVSKQNKIDQHLDIKNVVEEHAYGLYRMTRVASLNQSHSNMPILESGEQFEATKKITEFEYIQNQGYVSLRAILPNNKGRKISCLVWINLPRVSGAMISIGEEEVLKTLFTGYRSKANDTARKWFISETDSGYCIDIGNNRLTVPASVINDLSYILDELMDAYTQRISKFESTICSLQFPLSSNYHEGYKLIKVKRWLWDAILNFAWEHEQGSGDGKWNIFGGDQFSLRAHIRGKQFNWGGNIVISPEIDSLYTNYRKYDDEVVLVWNGIEEYESIEHLESVDKVHYWLKDKLIPEVLQWLSKLNDAQNPKQGMKAKVLKFFESSKQTKQSISPIDYYIVRDFKDDSLTLNPQNTFREFKKAIDELQRFFHLNQDLYLRAGGIIELYQGLLYLISEVREFDTHYIAGNLGVQFNGGNEQITVQLLEEHIQSKIEDADSGTSNSFRLDLILRCYQFLLDDRNCDIQLDLEKLCTHLTSANSLMKSMKAIEKRRV